MKLKAGSGDENQVEEVELGEPPEPSYEEILKN